MESLELFINILNNGGTVVLMGVAVFYLWKQNTNFVEKITKDIHDKIESIENKIEELNTYVDTIKDFTIYLNQKKPRTKSKKRTNKNNNV